MLAVLMSPGEVLVIVVLAAVLFFFAGLKIGKSQDNRRK